MGRELRHLGSTLKLLYQVDRSAFVIGTTASVLESLAYPLVLLVVWRGLELLFGGTKPENLVFRGVGVLAGLVGPLAFGTVLRGGGRGAAGLLGARGAPPGQ